MGEFGRIDIEKCLSYSHDLVEVLKNQKDVNNLMQFLEEAKLLQSYCKADFFEVKNLLEDYQKKIDERKQLITEAKSLIISNEDLDSLEIFLEEEIQKKRLLTEELRIVSDQIRDLEHKRVTIEARRQTLKKCEKDEVRAQRNLSMYASVTNIIPNMDDQTKISGHIVQKDKKIVQDFELCPTNASAFDICNNLWRMIDG